MGRSRKGGRRGPSPKTPEQAGLDPRFPIIEKTYTVPPMGERKRLRKAFKEVRSRFLQELAETRSDDLRASGITETQIEAMRNGRGPQGWNVHHKLPIHGGGKNEPDNLILIKMPPHDAIHRHLDPQVQHLPQGQPTKVQIAWPMEKLYLPPNVPESAASKAEQARQWKLNGLHQPGTADPANPAQADTGGVPLPDQEMPAAHAPHATAPPAPSSGPALRSARIG